LRSLGWGELRVFVILSLAAIVHVHPFDTGSVIITVFPLTALILLCCSSEQR